MLDYIKGTVTSAVQGSVTIEIAGVGIQLQVADATTYLVNQQTTIFCHLHWNQEQGPSLYGFAAPADRTLFCLLISCSGIGPRLALTLMSQLSTRDLIDTIATGNTKGLSALHGIGPKKADMLIMQLRSKVMDLLQEQPALTTYDGNTNVIKQVMQVLESLHYSRSEISAALAQLQEQKEERSFDALMRTALSYLAKHKTA